MIGEAAAPDTQFTEYGAECPELYDIASHLCILYDPGTTLSVRLLVGKRSSL